MSIINSIDKNNNFTYVLNQINFEQITVLKKENINYIKNSESIIKLALEAFEGIYSKIIDFKNKLANYNNVLEDRNDNSNLDPDYITNIHLLSKKEYDDIIFYFYQNILNYIELQSENKQGNKINAILNLDMKVNNYVRNVMLTYVASGGIVINDSIAIIDNINLDNSGDFLIFNIGKSVFSIKKSSSFTEFNILILKNEIKELINYLLYVEKEIDKNIKIILHSLNIINAIKKNMKLL